jgi:hypothetical protein
MGTPENEKTPYFQGVLHHLLLYEAAALTAELRRQSRVF